MLVKLLEIQRGMRGGMAAAQEVYLRITLQEGNSPRIIVVVGSPSEVYQKIKTKQVLKG